MFYNYKVFLVSFLVFIYMIDTAVSGPVWEHDPFSISLKDKELTIFQNKSRIMAIRSFQFNFIEPDSVTVEAIQGDTLILKLRFRRTDGFAEDFPTEILLTVTQSGNTFHFTAGHKTFRHITIQMEDRDEHYFGLIEKLYPHNAKDPDLRGQVVDVEVYGQGERDYAENYASAYSAFYMSSAGYGSFFDTFTKGRYQLAVNGITEIYHQTGTLDWYLFVGHIGQEIHRAYYDVIGVPKYVPIWACGPIFWRDQNNGGKDEILDDIKRFADLKIPLTACFLDRPYSDGNHNWSKMNFMDKFSEPGKWIKTINENYGLQFMTWVAPMTFSDMDFPGLLPNYKTYLDLTSPEALKEFETRLKTYQYGVGVKGHKMDRTDENFPITARWHDPVSESESRNTYVYLYAKVIHEFLTRAHGRDQFNFARAAFHRCQPYLSAVWGGDSRSNWQGMAGNQANAMRCGFMGFPVWGADTGGYLGEGRIDEMLYARWLQWGAWNGMFEIKIDGSGGSGEDRPPWRYSLQLQEIFRHACEQRMGMLPTIYSYVNTSHENGVVMKPLAYAYPKDKSTYAIWDEYIFGDAFLVAPIFTETNSRTIYLPAGTWIDYYDHGKTFQGPVTFTRDVPLDRIPVFIKQNAVYVTGNIYSGNTKAWAPAPENGRSITIHVFPGRIHEQATFQYVDYLDDNKEKIIQVDHQADNVTITSDPLSTRSAVRIKCPTPPERLVLNHHAVPYEYDDQNKTVLIQVQDNKPITLEIYPL